LKEKGIRGSNLTLKIKYDNFELITRSCNTRSFIDEANELFAYGEQLLIANWDNSRKIRLLGLGISKLENTETEEQLLIPL